MAPWDKPDGGPDDKAARDLVRRREQQLKGARARLTNPRALELWGGQSGTGRMDDRYRAASRLLDDMYTALGRERTDAGAQWSPRPPRHPAPAPGLHRRSRHRTTFSLDLVALLIAPLSFSLFDRLAKRDDPTADEHDALGATALLQAVRSHAERLTVYCQAGSIGSPGRYRQLLAYLEGSVIEVRPPGENGVFHPKVWVQRFTSPNGPVRYRLLVNSRNLTFDRSWDTMFSLEGELGRGSAAVRGASQRARSRAGADRGLRPHGPGTAVDAGGSRALAP